MLFFCLALAVSLAFAIPQLAFMVRRRKLLQRDWKDVVASIEPVNLGGIKAIAEMYLSPTKDQLRIEPPVMWELLGGIAGVRKLSKNADAILELCVLAEQWDHNGKLISELIRADIVDLKRALARIELATLHGYADARGHFALMQIASAYNLMRLRLLGQYEKSHVARLQTLHGRLGA
ncbi:hypothetical protein [Terriglobus aquaticus]|uniref:Uncharacterized protein n=1 Tax=Terriglobus aquaticus TaxID=940139 RepID=A0ABW9KEX3_9BACT|nr:hypothetical protein [Terriglobus aquaticus]